MKFLFTIHPALGHLHQMVPIARALQRARHEVVFATGRRFAERVRALGFRTFAAGVDWLEVAAEQTFPAMGAIDHTGISRYFVEELFTDRLVVPMVEDLAQIVRQERPDAIVRETWEFGGALAAESCRLPHAVVSGGLTFELWRTTVTERLSARRAQCGLPPQPDLRSLMGELLLDHVPATLHYPDVPLPAMRQPVGKAFFDGSDETPGEVPAVLDAPVVYVTAGTIFNEVPGYFQMIIDGLANEQVRVVITCGAGEAPLAPGSKLPPNVTVAGYIPQSRVLQHSALMICHGGFNTVLGAVNQGVPILTVPITAEQAQHGVRMAAVGCGLCLPLHAGLKEAPHCQDLAELPTAAPESIRDAARRLLHERSFALNSRKLQLEALAMPGPAAAVRALRQLVAPDEVQAQTTNRAAAWAPAAP